MSYSRLTKKGQVTIPAEYRRKYNLSEGVVIAFEETEKGLVIKPLPDITDSAGALAKYANPKELLTDLLKTREESFR